MKLLDSSLVLEALPHVRALPQHPPHRQPPRPSPTLPWVRVTGDRHIDDRTLLSLPVTTQPETNQSFAVDLLPRLEKQPDRRLQRRQLQRRQPPSIRGAGIDANGDPPDGGSGADAATAMSPNPPLEAAATSAGAAEKSPKDDVSASGAVAAAGSDGPKGDAKALRGPLLSAAVAAATNPSTPAAAGTPACDVGIDAMVLYGSVPFAAAGGANSDSPESEEKAPVGPPASVAVVEAGAVSCIPGCSGMSGWVWSATGGGAACATTSRRCTNARQHAPTSTEPLSHAPPV